MILSYQLHAIIELRGNWQKSKTSGIINLRISKTNDFMLLNYILYALQSAEEVGLVPIIDMSLSIFYFGTNM